MTFRKATLDPSLTARVTARRPLLYAEGADPAEDRPPHVRAASSITRFAGRYVIAQDDAAFLATVDDDGRVHAIPLPRGPAGERLFGKLRGNKKHKLDLEAAVCVPTGQGEQLLVFGSGSTKRRERIIVVEPSLAYRVVEARSFYETLRREASFAGSELNLEGAALAGDAILLVQRGNGAPNDERAPLDATCLVGRDALLAYLEAPDHVAPPPLTHVTAYDLGEADGVRITLTDATTIAVPGAAPDRGSEVTCYVAAAEASPDVIEDGDVTAVVFGVFGGFGPSDAPPRQTFVLDEHGGRLLAKVEGIALDARQPRAASGALRFIAVVDADDVERPAEWLDLEVSGVERPPSSP
jgi:hypothetical protein